MAQRWDTIDVADYLDVIKPVVLKFEFEAPQERRVIFKIHTDFKKYLSQLAKSKGITVSSLLLCGLGKKFLVL